MWRLQHPVRQPFAQLLAELDGHVEGAIVDEARAWWREGEYGMALYCLASSMYEQNVRVPRDTIDRMNHLRHLMQLPEQELAFLDELEEWPDDDPRSES